MRARGTRSEMLVKREFSAERMFAKKKIMLSTRKSSSAAICRKLKTRRRRQQSQQRRTREKKERDNICTEKDSHLKLGSIFFTFFFMFTVARHRHSFVCFWPISCEFNYIWRMVNICSQNYLSTHPKFHDFIMQKSSKYRMSEQRRAIDDSASWTEVSQEPRPIAQMIYRRKWFDLCAKYLLNLSFYFS